MTVSLHYSAMQLRIRAVRLTVAKLEQQTAIDEPLSKHLRNALYDLEAAEDHTAAKLHRQGRAA